MRIAFACVLAACSHPPTVVDLSTGLEPIRAEFDAHAGEARFLTLLSPT